MRNCCALFIALIVVATLAAPVTCMAQLYVANDNNGRVISYVDTSGTILNPGEAFNDIKGMAIEEDGTILVAEEFMIKRLDPVTGTITIIDPYGYWIVDVYPDAETPDIFTITGDAYAALNVMLAGAPPAEWAHGFDGMPVDLQIYPIGDRAGHVIVLVQGYQFASLQELVRTGPLTFDALDPIVEELTSDPAGFAITPDGGFVYLDHNQGMYGISPGGDVIAFGPAPMQGGWDHITIGSDGTIYVSDSVMNMIHRFTPEGDWILPSLSDYMGWPGALVAAAFTPVHEGSNVTTEPLEDLEVMFEEIAQGGYSIATPTTTMDRTSPGGNALPDHAISPAGRSDFTYVELETEAVYEDLIQVEAFWPGERMFFVYGMGDTFRDMTVVGSIEDARGVIPRFDSTPVEAPPGPREDILVSEIVLADDTRTLEQVAAYKFYWLLNGLGNAGHSPGQSYDLVYAKKHLERRVLRAKMLYDLDLLLSAIEELSFVATDIREMAGYAIPNSSIDPEGNVAGDLLARTKTLMFSLDPLVGTGERPDADGIGSALSLALANPAYGECRMALSGPQGVRAVARVYNAAGKLVRTVFEGNLNAGTTEVVWDGLNDANAAVASGVYFATVEAGHERVTRKLAYIR